MNVGSKAIKKGAGLERITDTSGLDQQLTEFARFLLQTSDYGRVLITGRGKSGTTWLARILRAHPQVAMLGERKLLEKNGPYEPLLRPFLTGDRLPEWFRYSSIRHWQAFERLPQELARVVSDYLLYLTVDPRGATHFGDKIPFNRPPDVPFVLQAVQELYGECRIINIVRDGRDTVVSGQFHRYRNAMKSGKLDNFAQRIDQVVKGKANRLFTNHEIANLAQSWGGVVRNTDRFGPEIFGEAFLSIRYEDLKADTPGVTKKMLAHLGLWHDEETVRQVTDATSFARLTGGREAGTEDPTSYFRKGMPGDWRTYFTRRDAKLFAEAANDMLLAQRYEQDPEWFRSI